jgi:RimJ/RimL family protein N-acetyltransferase
MEDGNLRLRPLRIADCPFILNGLNEETILKANGLSRPIIASRFFVWWWIKKTFISAYCIECDSKLVGLTGLYNFIPNKSAEMSLAIFDKSSRGKGYGTRAFNLLLKELKSKPPVRKIVVKIRTNNLTAIPFWKKLGFIETGIFDEVVTMSMDLYPSNSGHQSAPP